MGADGPRARQLLHPAQHQMVLGGQLGLPAVLDDHGLVRLDDDGGTLDLISGDELVARINQRAVPLAAGEEAGATRRRGQLGALGLARPLFERGAAADGFDRHGLDHQRFLAVDEAELGLVGLLEGSFHFLQA